MKLLEIKNKLHPHMKLGVESDWDIRDQSLIALVNVPNIIGGYFAAQGNKIRSLEGGPTEVRGVYSVRLNPNLVSLKGAPKIVGKDFNITHCPKLHSLEHANFACDDFIAFNTPLDLRTLRLCKLKVRIDFMFSPMDCTNILNILLHEGITSIEVGPANYEGVSKIINSHLKTNRDVHLCQEELIDAGFAQFAKI